MDIDDLETLVQKIASSPENRKISKMMRDNESQSAAGGLKVNKNGQFDLSNFAFGEFEPGGASKSIELTPEELDYKRENDDMFDGDGDDAEERHRSNPYLTKNEKQKMGLEDEEEGNEDDQSVKLNYSEQGIEIAIGNTTGIIRQDEIPALYDFVKSIMDDNKEGMDE